MKPRDEEVSASDAVKWNSARRDVLADAIGPRNNNPALSTGQKTIPEAAHGGRDAGNNFLELD